MMNNIEGEDALKRTAKLWDNFFLDKLDVSLFVEHSVRLTRYRHNERLPQRRIRCSPNAQTIVKLKLILNFVSHLKVVASLIKSDLIRPTCSGTCCA